jgi:hypothetical protein
MPKTKRPKKPKTKSTKTLKKEAWTWFSKWIRLRDALLTTGDKKYVKCTTCEKVGKTSEMEAGHFKHGRFDFDERNIHTQCTRCNKYLSGNGTVYAMFMLDTYGRTVVDFLANNKETRLLNREDYEYLRDYYKEEFEETYRNN